MSNSGGTVAVVGLGSMGWGAALSLLRAGFAVRAVDLRPELRERFATEGGTPCERVADACDGASTLFVFVVNANQTEQVLFGDGGAVGALARGAVVVACATVPPAYAAELGERLEARGLLALDAPVSGGAAKALQGQITIMGSGSPDAYRAAAPALDAIAAKVYRLGDRPGAGSKVKMINQLLAGVHIAAACEAMTLGIREGLDPQTLYEVISSSAGTSWMFENRMPHVIDGDYTPRSAVDIFVKDLGIVLEAGEAAAFPLPMARAAYELFAAAQAAGLGREDDAAVAKVYARRGKLALPRERS